ncbi:hypothetical protein NQ317_004647 [Molorchus minor]|uniref:Uncharacterized protein n=1 Tax=Molorchus minor TaxID=1323400 RepID=A0ABQ9IR60_9CUCU|nr:hypothetical protein NQ317_004647 [Molorchus minor]
MQAITVIFKRPVKRADNNGTALPIQQNEISHIDSEVKQKAISIERTEQNDVNGRVDQIKEIENHVSPKQPFVPPEKHELPQKEKPLQSQTQKTTQFQTNAELVERDLHVKEEPTHPQPQRPQRHSQNQEFVASNNEDLSQGLIDTNLMNTKSERTSIKKANELPTNELTSEHASINKANELTSEHASINKANELTSEHASINKANELTSEHASINKANELTSEHASINKANELTSEHASINKANELTSEHASINKANELTSEHTSIKKANPNLINRNHLPWRKFLIQKSNLMNSDSHNDTEHISSEEEDSEEETEMTETTKLRDKTRKKENGRKVRINLEEFMILQNPKMMKIKTKRIQSMSKQRSKKAFWNSSFTY